MARVFLSYSRDDRALVQPLAAAIEGAGHELWWDRKIAGGAEYSGEIEAALERAEAVVVVWSRASTRSAWVRDEAAFARDQGKLVPVTIDDAGPPLGFRQIHAVDLRGWDGDPQSTALDELHRSLGIRAGQPPAPARAAPPRPSVERRAPRPEPAADGLKQRRQRTAKVVGIVFAMILLGKCISQGRMAFEPAENGRIVIERPDGGRVDFSQDKRTGKLSVKRTEPAPVPAPPRPPSPPTDNQDTDHQNSAAD